jgi:NAD-dependent deacetylase sirtuin 4
MCVQFMANDANRRRYWARSFVGWREFADVQPNGAHEGLARLQANGWVSSILTQNVDRLHQKAGARHVLEIHGTTHECATSCMAFEYTDCNMLYLYAAAWAGMATWHWPHNSAA